jgi:hypothetical protein
MILLYLLIATLGLWALFIPMANLKNAYEDRYHAGTLVWWKQYPTLAFLYFFVTVDVIYNYTYGAMLFMQPAHRDRKTLTSRLKHYLRTEPDSVRGKMAYFFCRYMISPWDWNHCGMGNYDK